VAVRYTGAFKRQLKRLARKYRRIRADLEPIISQLQTGETPGDQIQGGGYTVYKVRVRNTDTQRGTSGGYRVIYYIVRPDDILLLTLYSKTEQDDVHVDAIVRIIEQAESP
jgi:mRNA-degrading endonuclease RelE of RelBE toxin-antitoxin system